MKRLLLATLIVVLIVPSFSFLMPEIRAASSAPPLAPHEVRVLVVSPADPYLKGGHYLISDLARYGFNVVQHISDNATGTNYVTDPQTSNLGQYDVVILYSGSLARPPSAVSLAEVNHFANFGGTLIVVGNALFRNETAGNWWSNLFTSVPIQRVEQRLGVDFTNFLKEGLGATYPHNNGTFTLKNNSIKGLPQNLTYLTNDWMGNANNQLVVAQNDATQLYDFTTTNGKTAAGVTYYKNSTGAVGIYIQGSYIHATSSMAYKISYYGLRDISKRSALLASLIAFALDRDIDTIIKPQPFASIRLDGLGSDARWDETYLNASLANFNRVIDSFEIKPTIGFTDVPPTFEADYWKRVVPNILSQLKGVYRDWEYSSSLRNKPVATMTTGEIEALVDNIRGNYTDLGIDLFSTVTATGVSQDVLNALGNRNLTLIDLLKNSPSWWNLDVASNVIIHRGAPVYISQIYENFTQINPDVSRAKDRLHYEYYRYRDEWMLALINGFPSFLYNVRNFRWNEVGTFSLQTFYNNLTYEIPDLRFVPLTEAALYFGNKWASVQNTVRAGSDIEFDINSQAVPEAVGIGKGMLWLRVATNETIRDVWVDGEPWYYFDENSIRVPASATHVKVSLGTPTTPRVVRALGEVTNTVWGLARFTVFVSAQPGLNVTLRLLIPEDPFSGFPPVNWTVFSSETKWGYRFDESSRLVDFWAVSDDGLLSFKVGFDVVPPHVWSVNHTRTEYDLAVTVTVNATELQTSIESVILSYAYNSSEWINQTMTLQNDLFNASIPAFPWGTSVKYRINASDTTGNWAITQLVRYNVTDTKPPRLGIPTWNPNEPAVGEIVTLKVEITEPPGASGIKKVNLWYRRHGAAWEQPLPMTLEGGLWTASFPALDTDTVDFTVEALDNAGNKVLLPRLYSFKVLGGTIINLPTLLLVSGTVAAAISIGTVAFFVRRRKKLNRTMEKVSASDSATV